MTSEVWCLKLNAPCCRGVAAMVDIIEFSKFRIAFSNCLKVICAKWLGNGGKVSPLTLSLQFYPPCRHNLICQPYATRTRRRFLYLILNSAPSLQFIGHNFSALRQFYRNFYRTSCFLYSFRCSSPFISLVREMRQK